MSCCFVKNYNKTSCIIIRYLLQAVLDILHMLAKGHEVKCMCGRGAQGSNQG